MSPAEPLLLPAPQAVPSPPGEACPAEESPERQDEQKSLVEADELYVFSYFRKPIHNTNPMARVGLRLVYNLIRDEVFSKPTHILRMIEDEDEARKYKANHFDYVTFSGVFIRRDGKCLKRHSGLLCLDFDHLEDPLALRKALIRDKYFETLLAFVSPSGHGLKWVIPIEVSSLCPHERWFSSVRNYIQQTYKVQVDPSGRDVARACFLPHDPGVYIHPKLLA
jgi:hypothetical protein